MRQAVVLALVAASLAAGAPSSSLPAAGQAEPFTLGILRRDGVVTPLAVFNGDTWSSPWPASLRSSEPPPSLDQVPKKWWGKSGPLERMTLWTGGERRAVLQLRRPVAVSILCTSTPGLGSDYVSPFPLPPPGTPSFPKDGLVISGPTAIDAIESVSPDSPEWAASAALVSVQFDAAEARAASGFSHWTHPVPRPARRSVPLAMESLFRAPMDVPGWTAYRFQAVKRYPAAPADHGCGPLSSASGWIGFGPDGRHWTELTVRITYCDRMDDLYTVPLGRLGAGGRSYWIYQLSGVDHEGYVIARPTPRAVETVVQHDAGSCPR